MRRHLTTAAIAAVAVALLTACGADPTPTPTATATTTPTATPTSTLPISSYPRIAVTQDHQPANDRWYQYEYPTFSAADGAARTQAIVDDLNQQVSAERSSFEARSSTECKSDVFPDEKCTFIMTVDSQYASEKAFVMKTNAYLMLSGAAHGDTALRTYAYDATTGTRLVLEDQLRSGAIDKLRAKILAAIPSSVGPFEDVAWSRAEVSDALQGPDAFLAWLISDNGLSIQFNAYLVGPYSLGQPTVWLSWDDIRTLFKPGSPLLP